MTQKEVWEGLRAKLGARRYCSQVLAPKGISQLGFDYFSLVSLMSVICMG